MSTTTRCARCGRDIDAGSYLCDRCREEEGPSLGTRIKPPSDLEQRAARWPSWIPKPSPVQYHATVAISILVVLLGLAAFAFLMHRGVGPFTSHATTWEFRPPSALVVVADLRIDGSKSARANCRITEVVDRIAEASEVVLTDAIPAGETIHLRHVLTGVDAAPTGTRDYVTCS